MDQLEKSKKALVNELNSTEEAKPEVISKLEVEANFEAKPNLCFTTTQGK